LPGDPIASEQIWMPFSSAARLKAACVFGSRKVGVLPSAGYCTLTWMPSRPISRASAILLISPRWPRFQSVMPTRTGIGFTCAAASMRDNAGSASAGRAADASAAWATKSRLVMDIP
jgi:hypothetical protein